MLTPSKITLLGSVRQGCVIGYTVIMFIFCEKMRFGEDRTLQRRITNSNHPALLVIHLLFSKFRNNLKNMVYTQAILLKPIYYITKNCQSEKLFEKTGNNLVLNRHFWNILRKSHPENLIQNPMPSGAQKNFRMRKKS